MLIGADTRQSHNLAELRRLGVRIALDDFGTGYSALGYLTRFPIDQIKIDRSFVDGLEHGPQNTALVQAILTLARGLELTVIAEGIETPGQHRLLTRLGCPLGQGYLFAPPRAAQDISPGQLGAQDSMKARTAGTRSTQHTRRSTTPSRP